jgi:gamma-glutamyltranspeptidase
MGFPVVGRLSPTEYKEVLNRSCTVVDEEDLVQFPSLTTLQNDSYINKLVELQNVQFSEDAVGETYYDPANDIGGGTNYLITDEAGNTIIFRTSAFANFGADIIPDKSGTIRGILTKYQDTYQFMIRTEEDMQLNQNRF